MFSNHNKLEKKALVLAYPHSSSFWVNVYETFFLPYHIQGKWSSTKISFSWFTSYLFLTKHLTTQRASWSDRSASSKTSLLDPLTNMLTVRPGLVTPVTLTTLLVPRGTSSTSSAVANISGVKWSKLAIGLHPKLWNQGDNKFTAFISTQSSGSDNLKLLFKSRLTQIKININLIISSKHFQKKKTAYSLFSAVFPPIKIQPYITL